MVRLKSIAKFISDGDWVESKDQSPDGIRLIQTGNIGNGEYLDKLGRAKFISQDTFSRLNCTALRPNDILISRLPDPIGRSCIIPGDIGHAITAVDCTILRLNPDLCKSKYFVYYTQSPYYQLRLSTFFAGSTRTRISRKNLETVEVPLVALPEQQHIVDVLDSVCNLISLRKQQLAKLDELVKARFVEMFGNPVHNTRRLPIKRLALLGSLDRGRSKHRPRNDPELLNGPYPLIQTGEVASSGLYITSYKNTYSELGLKQSKMWNKGTLCITIAANIAQTAILSFDACFPDSVVGFVPYREVDAVYMHYWFSFFQKILEEQAPQVAQKNINLRILSELEVMVPSKENQDEFGAFVEKTEKFKLTIQQSLDKLEILKKVLMQEYFR